MARRSTGSVSNHLKQHEKNNLEMDEVDKQLRKLNFKNPGRFLENFNPETSGREIRKMTRKLKGAGKKNALYDDKGVHIATNLNMCDCLDKYCPGCHFECPKCGSGKCGTECRSTRRWIYETVEVEGTNYMRRFKDTWRRTCQFAERKLLSAVNFPLS